MSTEPSLWQKLTGAVADVGQKVKDAMPKSAVTDDQQLRQSLALPSDGQYTVAGGRRRKTRSASKKRKGGARKTRSASKRKH